MGNSIIILLLIGAALAGVGAIFSNLMRVSELKELEKQLSKYERAFAVSIKAQRKTIEKINALSKKVEDKTLIEFPEMEIHVVGNLDLPKFGDE